MAQLQYKTINQRQQTHHTHCNTLLPTFNTTSEGMEKDNQQIPHPQRIPHTGGLHKTQEPAGDINQGNTTHTEKPKDKRNETTQHIIHETLYDAQARM